MNGAAIDPSAVAPAPVTARDEQVVALINRALIAGRLSGPAATLAQLDAAAATGIGDVRLHAARARTLLKLRRFAHALSAAEAAVAAGPHHADGYELRSAALRGLGRYDEALSALHAPRCVTALGRLLVGRAVFEMEAGRAEAAGELLRSALAREPELAPAWFSRAELGDLDASGADIATMKELAGCAPTESDRILLNFALGKAFLERNEHTRAFAYFQTGNALARRRFTYDVADDLAIMRGLAAEFSAATLARGIPGANRTERPVFVVGMPRSGTSLVEALLAAHPEVFGAGELRALPEAAFERKLRAADEWPSLAAGYLATAGANAGDAARVVDKLPTNFVHVGLIRMLFPNARIIHCRRNPLDTALSCFFTLFDEGHEFSYDLVELGRLMRGYAELVAHWRRVVPADRLIEVDYENIVADTEREAQRLIAFCGLDWDPAVLRFHQSLRAVRTASKLQVRRPIYRTSVDRAHVFGALLDPLRAALAGRPSESGPQPRAENFVPDPRQTAPLR